ncbi:MAG: DUF1622 domain-containing protein [Acidimicrobiia bacterium]
MLWILASESGIKVGDFAVAETIADLIELAAVLAITIAVIAAIVGALHTRIGSTWTDAFQTFKRYMGLGLLIGLDLLIAGDIIKTVTLEPTFENAAVLGLLVLIRTFLSWTIVLEVNGRWPWQSPPPGSTNDEKL